MSAHPTTSEKILLAAITLMAEKGYDGTTTREIALAAGVNEVTLFRHFGTKEKLLEAAFSQFHYGNEMTKLFSEGLKGNLYEDLLTLSRTYHSLMNRNRNLISIALKGSHTLPDSVLQEASRNPKQLKNLLADYLTKMSSEGKAASSNPEIQALSFMWMNYGAFISTLNAKEAVSEAARDEFIEESVHLFAKALSPNA
ncbi:MULTISPECIES: TetR/AcrR family transcriptional regulator [unclassified Paenibacillus]|uniref:TetR/AcrR family transcriptional regulator n=1 Tax=unclassified Paenibacillus TaxID=185978 RepID=UPI000955B94B|nr:MULTISPECIES: TetR/AcrR family transcriptional regulator [unclassified Paenibacillus]ASS67570.1 TetR/AcrR family transcriptional regulator [Paenibacillus sp. RUD330]SIQ72412.1 transcriptional regulator, TetR family [Paenibacillus sp. RU4X]SIQ93909.1 transcriptional regulator, TetR family [Paenibacillus sp. RU4T]